MKFNGSRPSAHDKDIEIYDFTMNKVEMFVLMDILMDAKRRTPRSLFTQPLTSRLNAIAEELSKTFKEKK